MYVCYRLNYELNGQKVYDDHPSILCNYTTKIATVIEKPKERRCFIATVTCGYNSWEVKTLSIFRDKILLAGRMGSLFARFYYEISPYLASYVRKRKTVKGIIRSLVVHPAAILASKLISELIGK